MAKNLKEDLNEDPSFRKRVRNIVWEDPSISARLFPYLKDEKALIIPKMVYSCVDMETDDRFPVPPQELWAGTWASSAEYLASGKDHSNAMMNILGASGFRFGEKHRILDFGCGAGRIIRCFKPLKEGREIWGVDISTKHILWCHQNLCPPFKFITTTTFPHLPFEDNYFDIIYAGSVFTHISELAGAWLLELRRILRPEGRCYITVRDNHSIEMILSSPPGHRLHDTPIRQQLIDFDKEKHFLESGFSMIVLSRDPGNAEVFYDIDFLRQTWGNFFEILSINHEAFGSQTAITLSK